MNSPVMGAWVLPTKNNQNLTFEIPDKPQIVYQNNVLFIYGIEAIGSVQVFSLIGNKVGHFNNVNLREAALELSLVKNNLYIIRIVMDDGSVKTFKIRAS